jgi:protein involved in polysaccharide export with SLBB domain
MMQPLNARFSASAKRWLPLACAVSTLACAPTDTMRIDPGAKTSIAPDAVAASQPDSATEVGKLESLFTERQAASSRNEDYPIGPGDVLTVSVPDVEQLAQRRVRVSTRGTIELPLLGAIQAGGLSEDGLAAEIDDKLQKYMYQPQADVFVDEYHNRAVAVVGAVNHPGLVLLTSPSESLLDVITQAGGLSGAAADEVILIPSRPGTVPNSAQFASRANSRSAGQIVNGAAGTQTASADSVEPMQDNRAALGQSSAHGYSSNETLELARHDSLVDGAPASSWLSSGTPARQPGLGAPSLAGHDDAEFTAGVAHGPRGAAGPLSRGSHGDVAEPAAPPDSEQAMQLAGSDDAVTLKLKGATLAGVGKYVNMPMRPGDVLIVPGGGDVMVVGWVHQPGRFQVGSGLTVLGAIGAAGGPMYAAKSKGIVLIRSGEHGGKITIPINMDQITRGEAPDLPVQANDVIDVPYSGLRIGPYIFYSILTKMGIGGPVIPY